MRPMSRASSVYGTCQAMSTPCSGQHGLLDPYDVASIPAPEIHYIAISPYYEMTTTQLVVTRRQLCAFSVILFIGSDESPRPSITCEAYLPLRSYIVIVSRSGLLSYVVCSLKHMRTRNRSLLHTSLPNPA